MNPLHGNMNNIYFMKITIFPSIKMNRMSLLYIFANLFNVWLNREQLNFHICLQYGFNLLQYVFLLKVYEGKEKHMYTIGKGRSILVAFSVDFG